MKKQERIRIILDLEVECDEDRDRMEVANWLKNCTEINTPPYEKTDIVIRKWDSRTE